MKFATINLHDNLDELDFDELPGIELEEDIVDPCLPSHGHIVELEEDDAIVIMLAKHKRNFISTIGDVTKCEVGTVDWIFPGMLREGSVAMFVGHPGAGKSTFTLKFLDAIANGREFLGHQCERRPVLYLDRDANSLGDVQDRLKWLGIKTGGSFKFWGANVPDEEVPMPSDKVIVEWVKSLPKQPVILCDSFVHFLDGGDENNASEVNRLWTHISGLKRAGCSFIFLHHMGKGEQAIDFFRGSTAIRAGIDFGFKLENASSTGKTALTDVKLKRVKQRNITPFGNDNNELFVRIGEDGSFTVAGKPKIEEQEADAAENAERLHAVMKANPGIGAVRFDELADVAGVGQTSARTWRLSRVSDGEVVKRRGPKPNQWLHYLAEDAPTEANDLGEGLLPSE